MTPDLEFTAGEISRSLARIENTVNNLALSVQASMTLAAAQSVKIEVVEDRTNDLEKKVDSLTVRTTYIAGGISALIGAANFFLGRHS